MTHEQAGAPRRGVFIGLTVLDIINRVDRYPHANEKVTATAQFIAAGGPAANAAVTFAALGGDAVLVTAIGTKIQGNLARADLEAHGVHIIDCASPEFQISTSCISVTEETGDRAIVSLDAGNDPVILPAELEGPLSELLCDSDVLLVDGHHPDLTRSVLDLRVSATDVESPQQLGEFAGSARTAQLSGVAQGSAFDRTADAPNAAPPLIVDCGRWKPQFAEILPHADHVLASNDFCDPYGWVPQLLETAPRQMNPGSVIVRTRGGDSAYYWVHEGRGEVSAEKRIAVDTSGAGDAFHGGYAYALAQQHAVAQDQAPAQRHAPANAAHTVHDLIAFAHSVAAEKVAHAGPRSWLSALGELSYQPQEVR